MTFVASSAWGANPFVDIGNTGTHAPNIDAIFNAGISLGCTDTTHYCPNNNVTRAQMASFLARTAGLSTADVDNFPVANARSPIQAYCSVANTNPASVPKGPCRASEEFIVSNLNDPTGLDAAMAIGRDGFPIISFYSEPGATLRVAHCEDAACVSSSIVTVDNAVSDVGRFSDITIGVDGFPVISYYDGTNGNLKVAKCGTLTCSTATKLVLDSTGVVGQYTSIVIDSVGYPLVAYYDATNGDLKTAQCSSEFCGGGDLPKVVDEAGDVGQHASIALAADGTPYISYFDATNGALKVAYCEDFICRGKGTVVNAGAGAGSVITIGTDGLPVIAHRTTNGQALRVSRCTTLLCTAVTTATVSTQGPTDVDMVISLRGLPVLSFREGGLLQLLECPDRSCSTFVSSTAPINVAASSNGTAVAIGVDGVPIVAFRTSNALYAVRPRIR